MGCGVASKFIHPRDRVRDALRHRLYRDKIASRECIRLRREGAEHAEFLLRVLQDRDKHNGASA